MVTALERFVDRHPEHDGSVALLVTSDEEGPSVNGVRRVMDTLGARGERIDWCLVGEPSSTRRLGDTVKIGRRGSLGGNHHGTGRPGPHRLSPSRAQPDPRSGAVAGEARRHGVGRRQRALPANQLPGVERHRRDRGGQRDSRARRGAVQLPLLDRHDRDSLVAAVESACRDLELDCRHRLAASPASRSSPSPDGSSRRWATPSNRSRATGPSSRPQEGRRTAASSLPTGAEVVELGPVNASIHSIDEHVLVADLDRLSEMYERVIARAARQRDHLDPVMVPGTDTPELAGQNVPDSRSTRIYWRMTGAGRPWPSASAIGPRLARV